MNPTETQPWMPRREGMPEWDNEPVSHEQAKQAVLAFTDEHFRQKQGRETQFRIPADKNDTDLLLMRYVRQQEWIVAHAPQSTQWIPVNERLPENKQMVFGWAATDMTNPIILRYVGGRQFHDFFKNWVGISHWMPLPAPPVPATPDKETK